MPASHFHFILLFRF